jgi:ABC-type Mn2+/Zn2+ transport system permease subunit
MLYRLGRALQVFALLILPAAIAGQLSGHFGTKHELILLGAGVLVFFIGWRLQEGGKA